MVEERRDLLRRKNDGVADEDELDDDDDDDHRCNELLISEIDQVERIMFEPLPKIALKSTIGRSFCQLALLPSENIIYSHSNSVSQSKLSTL